MYIPQPGPTRAPEVVANLGKLGNEVIALSPPERQFVEMGVRIRPIRLTNLPFVGSVFLIGFALILAILAFVRQRPEVLYTLGGSMGTGLLVAKLFRCPLISEVNGWRRAELRLIKKKSLAMFISRISCWLDEQEIKRSNHVIAVAGGIKEAIVKDLRVPPSKISVIPNGANAQMFRPMTGAKESLQLDLSCLYVGFVGIMAPWQGLQDLIRSAPLILREVPNTKFLMVGDGVRTSEVMRWVKQSNLTNEFVFVGEVAYAEVPRYISAMDLCISFRKGTPASPLKIYEYALCGKPVVATDCSDNSFVKEYGAGILVDPEKEWEVAKSIVSLLKDRELRERMGNNGRKYVLETRSWEAVAREIEGVIKATIAN